MDIGFEQPALEFEDIVHPTLTAKNIKLTIARLDKIHTDISGNKIFKLHYFLKAALATTHKRIITFGGAYSNHLVATAFAAKTLGLKATGIVRGEEVADASHTLQRCTELGMELIFISRSEYKKLTAPQVVPELESKYGEAILIPEGGFHPLGAKGASLIMDKLAGQSPTHVCVPVGTATTLAGLVLNSGKATIVGVPVLKNMTDIPQRIKALTGIDDLTQLIILDGYHFGGYARANSILTDFMNDFFNTYNIPLDFVYTAKMMFGVMAQIQEGYFPANSHIVCLHTGGLQGNKSLKPYNLTFQ